jgi:hypothetical protein
MLKMCGVIRFEGLNAVGLRILREFEAKALSGIRFTFGPAPDIALVRWDSMIRLAVISHMAVAGLKRCSLTAGILRQTWHHAKV